MIHREHRDSEDHREHGELLLRRGFATVFLGSSKGRPLVTEARLRDLCASVAKQVLLLALLTSAAHARCGGDCNGDGVVTADELVAVVNVRLGHAGEETCPAADTDFDGEVSAADPPAAVSNSLAGCPAEDRMAFVVATDYQTGSFATVTLDEPRQVEKANPQRR